MSGLPEELCVNKPDAAVWRVLESVNLFPLLTGRVTMLSGITITCFAASYAVSLGLEVSGCSFARSSAFRSWWVLRWPDCCACVVSGDAGWKRGFGPWNTAVIKLV